MKKFFLFFLPFLLIGCVSTSSKLKVTSKDTGEIIVDCSLDENLLKEISRITPGYFIAGVNFSRKDFLFIVEYNFNLSLGYEKSYPYSLEFPLEIHLKFPGKITKTNAEKVKQNIAVWEFNRYEGIHSIYLHSRYIRWYLIAGIIFLILVYRYSRKYFLR